jgi:hypothetical protein
MFNIVLRSILVASIFFDKCMELNFMDFGYKGDLTKTVTIQTLLLVFAPSCTYQAINYVLGVDTFGYLFNVITSYISCYRYEPYISLRKSFLIMAAKNIAVIIAVYYVMTSSMMML